MTVLNEASVESQNGSTAKITGSTSTVNSTKKKVPLMDDISEHISTFFHTTICVFTIYIVWLCLKDNETWSLLTWHVFLYTLGWVLFMTEGLLILTKENIYSKRISHLLRVRYHWIIETLAVVFSLAGFLCIFINKEDHDAPHFTSNHGLYGFIAIVFCLPTCLNGFTVLFNIELKRFIKPTVHKLFHAVCGIATLIVGGVSMIMSLSTGWFDNMTQKSEFSFYGAYIILVGGFLWCICRPTINSLQRIKGLLSK